MTLVMVRASESSVTMVTDRLLTADRALFDRDANKNLVFADRNAVVAIGYTGMAYIGEKPTDQWIAEALTGLNFPEGRRGPGSLPTFMTTQYEAAYWGSRRASLNSQLDVAGSFVRVEHQSAWRRQSFDLLVAGFEWNHGLVRPILECLSKPSGSDRFDFHKSGRNWYRQVGGETPFRVSIAPSANVREEDAARLRDELSDRGRDHVEIMGSFIKTISSRTPVVGPDAMSICMNSPLVIEPRIAVKYLPVGRTHGTLVLNRGEREVPVGFTPWIIQSGAISAPSAMTNLQIRRACGPYELTVESPENPGNPGAVSSQQRPPLP